MSTINSLFLQLVGGKVRDDEMGNVAFKTYGNHWTVIGKRAHHIGERCAHLEYITGSIDKNEIVEEEVGTPKRRPKKLASKDSEPRVATRLTEGPSKVRHINYYFKIFYSVLQENPEIPKNTWHMAAPVHTCGCGVQCSIFWN